MSAFEVPIIRSNPRPSLQSLSESSQQVRQTIPSLNDSKLMHSWCLSPNCPAPSSTNAERKVQHSQLAINIHAFPHPDFQPPHAFTRLDTPFLVINWRFKFIAPRTPPAISIAVIIAKQIVAAGFFAAAHFERLVDRGEKVFREVWSEGAEAG